jgi:hypothetical protein
MRAAVFHENGMHFGLRCALALHTAKELKKSVRRVARLTHQ